MFLIHCGERVAVLADAFRGAEKEIATRFQGVVEGRYDARLDVAAEIDEQVAARYQVHPREGWGADHTVRGEDTEFPDVLPQHIARAVPIKEAPSTLSRNRLKQRFGIASGTCHRDGRFVNVGREYLHARNLREGVHVLA